MDPLTIALITSLIGAGGSALGGALGRQKPTRQQSQQSGIIDQILQGVKGQGEFADLFNADEAAFQKSFIDPAQSRFKNQTAPQIQQQFIQSGQQRGTGLEDSLARAGIDMDMLLNEQFAGFQQGAQNRKSNALSGILGAGPGVDEQSFGSAAGQGLGGFLTSPASATGLNAIFDSLSGRGKQDQLQSPNSQFGGGRRGFA